MKKLANLATGLEILAPLYKDEPYSFHEGYLFVGKYEPERLTQEQVDQLERLGWFENEESWSIGE
jgi:hypothetical protein